MSIHHEVTIHCDSCGQWERGEERTTRQRREAGWRIWQEAGTRRWRHKCPDCAEGDVTARGGGA